MLATSAMRQQQQQQQQQNSNRFGFVQHQQQYQSITGGIGAIGGTGNDDALSVLDYGGLSNDVAQNNCFLNAVIQILYNADFFRRSVRNLAAIELGHYPNLHWRHRCSNAKQLRPSSSSIYEQIPVAATANSSNSSCIFCELVKLFDSLRVAQQSHRRFHDPNTLRLALQGSVANSSSSGHLSTSTFRLNQMNDSVECFEQILKTLHGYTSSTAVEDRTAPHSSDCTSETCVCHRQFSLTVAEQKTCSCGLVNSEVQIASDLVERVYVVPLLRAATRNSQSPCGSTQPPSLAQPSFSDLVRIAQCSVDPPLVCQGPRCGRLVHKTRRLLCKPDAIAISLTFPSACPDDLTLKQVIDLIEPTVDPARLYAGSGGSGYAEPFQLSGIICYHGHHYLAICYHSTRKVWNVISDSVVKHIGNSWADVRSYLRRAPCIPCLLLYTNPQAVALPRNLNGTAIPAANQKAEPIYFDRQAVQEMLAKSLKFPIAIHQQQPNASLPHSPLTQIGAYRRPGSSDATDCSSGYGSKSSSTASSASHDSATNSSCSPSPPSKANGETSSSHLNTAKQNLYGGSYQSSSTNSLEKLTSLLPPPQLVLPPNDQCGMVTSRFQQADILCHRLLAQLGAKQYADSLVACQQAANVLRSALVTNTGNGVTIENINSPHVISAKRRIDWLAHYERTILKKLGSPAQVPHPAPVQQHALTTFQTAPQRPVCELPPPPESLLQESPNGKQRTTLRQLKKVVPSAGQPGQNFRSSLPNIHQAYIGSKEAEDIPDRLVESRSIQQNGPESTNCGTLPRKLRLSPSSSNIPLTQNEHLAAEITPTQHILQAPSPAATVRPRFIAVRGPGGRVSVAPPVVADKQPETPVTTQQQQQQQHQQHHHQQPELQIRPTPMAPPSISGESQCSVGSSGHGSASSSSVTMQQQPWQGYGVRKSSLRSSRTSGSSVLSGSGKSVKFNDQVAVITEDLGPQDPIVDDCPPSSGKSNGSTVSLTVETDSAQCANYSVYVQRLVEHTRTVVYPTTKEQSEQFYVRRAVSKTTLRTVAKLNDRSSSPPPPLVSGVATIELNNEQGGGSTDSSDNTSLDEESTADMAGQSDGANCCSLCSKKLSAGSNQQYCHRCSAYLSRFSSPNNNAETVEEDSSTGVKFTAVANGAIF